MANDGKRAIFALCVHLCCPNFCHLLLCYDKAQGPFWSPSLSSAISSFPNSGIFKIRDPELQKQTMPLTVHAIQDVIGYGIVVLGTEQGNPNHPNIFMLQHLGNEEWQNCRDSRRKTLAILTHAMTDEGTRMNLEKSATLSMLSLLPTRFPKGYLSSFPE